MEPVKLQEWMNLRSQPNSNFHATNLLNQLIFVRDYLGKLFFTGYDERKSQVIVVAEHESEYITSPIYRILLPGITLTLSDYIYNWIISVDSETPLDFDVSGLVHDTSTVNTDRCPGFEPEWLFGNYTKSKKQFTVYLNNDYEVYTFLFLLKRCILMKQV